MKIKEIKNEKLGESVFCLKHSTGLEIRVMPREGYTSAYAVFATRYGSIDTSVKGENGEFEDIPAGTAHFLEHKLFESEEMDAFDRFAKTGANANAYTSWEMTAYLFQCSENFKESLEILLDFVTKPYFTQQTVEKEQGIIGQEIRMINDIPERRVFFNMLEGLYSKNPVKIEIAGTQESIAEIDADLLYRLYYNFYCMNNMVLCVVGNVSVDDVVEVADRVLPKDRKGEKAQRKFIEESPLPVKTYVEEKVDVAAPQFLLGYKERISKPELTVKEELATKIMLEAILGKASPLFRDLFDKELVDMGFDKELVNGTGYSFVSIGGTSKDPEKAADIIRVAINKLCETGIAPEAFERAKRKVYGRLIMLYNDIDDTANMLMSMHFAGCRPFEEIDACKGITLDNANERLRALRDEFTTLSVIRPVE